MRLSPTQPARSQRVRYAFAILVLVLISGVALAHQSPGANRALAQPSETALSLQTNSPCTAVSETASPTSPRPVGTAVVVTSVATGCSSPTYQYWLRGPGLGWSIVQPWSASGTYTWTTTGLTPGTYQVAVWSRQAGSTATSEWNVQIDYTLTGAVPCSAVLETASAPSPQLLGSTVTISAVASPCASPTYQFWLQGPGVAWTIVQPWSASASFSWDTSFYLAGTYQIAVWSRQAGSTATSEWNVQMDFTIIYPVHTAIVSTTFWVGEVFNPMVPDGSQVCSTYDSQWAYHWSGGVNNGTVPASSPCAGSIIGGCDGVPGTGNACTTETRTATNNYFPTSSSVHPAENPFYLDLPYDDLNDSTAYGNRCLDIPWRNQTGFAGHCTDPTFSYMKNRWVKITGPHGATCYGQIEDAGPSHGSLYHDKTYVFGGADARPVQTRYNNAGMDVSPALNGCLQFDELDGQNDHVQWQFVDASAVPTGPWTQIVTTSGVTP